MASDNRKLQITYQALLAASVHALTLLCWLCDPAGAQGTAPSSGVGIASPNETNRRHLGPTGKPCLSLTGSSKPQLVNHNMINHSVSVSNSCGQRLKVNVCYYRTQECIMIDVPPYERKEAVLGVFPKVLDFRFDYKEQF
jgi:hypothetical protein